MKRDRQWVPCGLAEGSWGVSTVLSQVPQQSVVGAMFSDEESWWAQEASNRVRCSPCGDEMQAAWADCAQCAVSLQVPSYLSYQGYIWRNPRNDPTAFLSDQKTAYCFLLYISCDLVLLPSLAD